MDLSPISLSNLENNRLEDYGLEIGLKFTQNSVPFDFNSACLLWMDYLEKGVREICIFDFESKEKQVLMTFSGKDGIISHCKLMGNRANLRILYVKDTTKLMIYDVKEQKH